MSVNKFRSINLLGETHKEEERRLRKEKIKLILKKGDRAIISEIKRDGKGYLAGTSKSQRILRDKIRKSAGLK